MIGYLLRRLSDVPDGDDWLTPAERRWFTDRRSAKRVADWRLGRWTAKAAIGAFLERRGLPVPEAIEILAAADGAPEAHAEGRALEVTLSLSHSQGRGVAAVAATGVALGCDIERVEPRSPAFLASYLTPGERAALAAAGGTDRDLLANLIWSAKESALKTQRRGLRADTRSVEVRVTASPAAEWGRLEISRDDGDPLLGRWTRLDDLVATIVSRPPPEELVDLTRER